MRFVRHVAEHGPALGVVEGDQIIPLDGPTDLIQFVRLGKQEGITPLTELAHAFLGAGSRSCRLEAVELLPPVHRPTKVIGVGMNYDSFVAQLSESGPAYPVLFHKTSSALTGGGQPILLPPITEEAVPEGELAVIIGRSGFDIDEQHAHEYVLGYTCANDVSARNLEFRTSQWTSGKMLPTFCPLGPWVVTADEFGDPDGVSLRTTVNEQVVQEGNTSGMIFGVTRLISEISRLVKLEVGDVLLTGTPSDLGEPPSPVFLRPGDIVCVEVERIGRLENPVRQS
jgi:2-keto-4-pentenoate hydratase/2-oxohepta-3-ene-1,7-dioic acid hydratase in catechol pathway